MLGIAAAAQRPLQLVDVTHEVERPRRHRGRAGARGRRALLPGRHHPPRRGRSRRGHRPPRSRRADGPGASRRSRQRPASRRSSTARRPGAPSSCAAAEYRLPSVSRTFHGRDVFAPAAAHLAAGVAPERFGPRRPRSRSACRGPRCARWRARSPAPSCTSIASATSSRRSAAEAVDGLGGAPRIRLGGRALPLVGTYARPRARCRPGALVGSSGRLEIAVREGSAAARAARPAAARRWSSVALRRRRRGGAARTPSTSWSAAACRRPCRRLVGRLVGLSTWSLALTSTFRLPCAFLRDSDG